MLKHLPKHVGKTIEITVAFEPESREIQPPECFINALAANKEATRVFNSLPPLLKLEIVRYWAQLKRAETVQKTQPKPFCFYWKKNDLLAWITFNLIPLQPTST